MLLLFVTAIHLVLIVASIHMLQCKHGGDINWKTAHLFNNKSNAPAPKPTIHLVGLTHKQAAY